MLEYLYLLNTDIDVPTGTDPARTAPGTPGRINSDFDRRMGALELATETLIRLGVSHGTYTEEEFFNLARQIDSEDGVMDGRRDLMRMRKICPTCGKPNSANKPVCMWCTTSIIDVPAEVAPPTQL